MTKNFTPDPVLIEAAKFAREYVANAYPDRPSLAWICDAVADLHVGNQKQAEALKRAVDAALGTQAFLPFALWGKGIGPFVGGAAPQGEERRQIRLWWLDQIIAGNPVPGAEV